MHAAAQHSDRAGVDGPFGTVLRSHGGARAARDPRRSAVEKQRPEVARPDALLDRLRDVAIIDSTSKLLGRLAHLWAPSTSQSHGGIKIDAITSLGSPIIHHYETIVQTTHDSKHLRADQFAPGTLVLYDLGYVAHEREAAMNTRGDFFFRRRKDSENPRIVKLVPAKDSRAAQGHRLRDAVRDDRFVAGPAVDFHASIAEVKSYAFGARIVRVPSPDRTTRWYLTNPPRGWLAASDVAQAYALRWEVGLVFKSLKSGLGPDTVKARRSDALMAFVHAKTIALALWRLLYLAATERAGPHAVTQMAIVLAMTRMLPWIMARRAKDPAWSIADEQN